MNRCLPYILFIVNLFTGTATYAGTDSSNYAIHYSIENGLPTNKIYSCVQDRYGYIWMATDNGVVKYDGYVFKVFTTSDGLPNNDVWRLFIDSHDRIWVHSHGYSLGYIKNDKYVTVYTSDTRVVINEFIEINGMCLYNNFYSVTAIDSNDRVYKSRQLRELNHYYSLGLDGVMYEFHNYAIKRTNYNRLTVDGVGNCHFQSDSINTIFGSSAARDNQIYGSKIGSSNELTIFNINTCGFRKVTFKNDEDIYLVCLQNDVAQNNGYFVFTTKRVYTLNRQFDIVDEVLYSNVTGIKTQVTYVSSDSFKNKWYSTNDAGVWQLSPSTNFFKQQPISRHLAGMQLVGNVMNGNTYWWDKLNRVLKVVDKDLKLLYQQRFGDNLMTITNHDSEYLNIAFRGGAFRYNIKKRALVDYLYNKPMYIYPYVYVDSTPKRYVRVPVTDKKYYLTSQMLNVHSYSGDKLFITTPATVVTADLRNDGSYFSHISIERVPHLLYDKANDIYWAYNDRKIEIINPDNDSVFIVPPSILRMLNVGSIQAIKADASGNLYMMAANALIIFNPRRPVLKYYNLNFDLSDARMDVFNGVVLIAAKAGLSFAKTGSDTVSSFRCILNPGGKYYNRVHDMCINANGVVILSTDKGVYAQHLDSLTHTTSSYYADGRDFAQIVVYYKNGERVIKNYDTISIPPDNQNFRIELVNFFGKGARSYSYRIGDGSLNTNASGEILFSWEPDKYYEVRCVAKDETWESNEYVFYVKRIPYWWQTQTSKRIFWISAIGVLIGLGIVVALITRYYVRKANEKKQALTDMELRALYAQINPHFIFNTLGTAQFFINRKKMDEAYNHINKFSRLLRAYLKASGNRYVTLSEDISLLKDYIELQQIRFEQKFDYKIEVDNKVAADSMLMPSLLIQPLVENAINHGLFHMKEGEKGMLEIRFKQGKSSEELVCIIEDNGVGRERSKQIKKDSLIEKDESYGTTLTKKLIDIFRQYEKMNIYLEYIDKSAPETGTIVKLTIGNIKYVA